MANAPNFPPQSTEIFQKDSRLFVTVWYLFFEAIQRGLAVALKAY